ncbi:MAG: ABC transporter substrate-binding protein [Burkholderiales bacterium]|uniref:ABC transporter substrate-binding protein n=1 Tax=Limnohabitans sp. TaxID=1907725 RepID=UPI0037BF3FC0
MSSVHRTRRSMLLAALGSLATTSGLPALASDMGRHLPRVKLALAASQSLYHLPLTVAEHMGFFRQKGIQVEWLPQESGAQALQSVLNGQAEVMAGAYEHLFGLHQKGLPYQSFVQMSRTPQVSLGGSTRTGKSWQSMTDIRGARLGVSALDSTTHWMACQWLRRNGMSQEEVVFVEVGSSAGVTEALRSGSIDALCNPDPIMHWLEQKNEIRLLCETRTLTGTRKVMGGAVPGASLMAHADLLQRHPDRVQALTDGLVLALKWLPTAGLTDILKTVPSSHWSWDRAAYLGAFEKLRESYAVDGLVRSAEVIRAWQVHAHLRPPASRARVLPERTFTNAFVQAANTAQRLRGRATG